jgi:putative DNA primase/helicase
MIVGASRSGKGTVARVWRALLDHANFVGPTLSSLKDQFGMQPLINKKAAIISDAWLDGHNQHEIVERLLTISGGRCDLGAAQEFGRLEWDPRCAFPDAL